MCDNIKFRRNITLLEIFDNKKLISFYIQCVTWKNGMFISFCLKSVYFLAKPIDCLTSAFKMHLLSTLMKQLCGILAADVGTTVTDFVEISHLLLDICTAPALSVDLSGWENVPKTKRGESRKKWCDVLWTFLFFLLTP